MRVLVTGATGFLGSHVARACLDAGFAVAALRRPTSRLDRLAGVAERIAFFDSRAEGIAAAFGQPCDAVIHTATCYGRHSESWSALLEANTLFPLRVLEALVGQDSGCFLNVGTVLDPSINPYAFTKGQFSDWGRMAVDRHAGLGFVNFRLEHIYGPGDDPSKLVTHLVRQCLQHAASIPLTLGEQQRDFIHVDDAVAGILRVLRTLPQQPSGWREYDLGSGKPIKILELAETIHRLCGSRARLDFGALPYRKNETMDSAADTSPLQALGWRCRIALEDGLRQTIDFERQA
jgi:CDP-paratose synthetase